VVVPVFSAECARATVRGSLLVAYQLATIAGIIVAYLVAYLLADSHSWRWTLGLAAVPAVLILMLLLPMPPRAGTCSKVGWCRSDDRGRRPDDRCVRVRFRIR
jgi:SP family galactose:H+ symporter-like MFS transporter